MQVYQDGVNAHRMASDYLMQTVEINAGDVLTLNLAPAGGWSATLHRVEQ
ncbi:MAG: hypothetical protein HC842_07195 [Cytophagales bacterium]|nr:hypothetical protein [Cytophagales bacterium]